MCKGGNLVMSGVLGMDAVLLRFDGLGGVIVYWGGMGAGLLQ
jgi:hypothetical protein